MYYAAVGLLLVLGVIGVYNSREYRSAKINSQGNTPPTVNQSPEWYEGFAVDACGKLLPPIKTNKDPYGITTKGDGIIYIVPTVKAAAGRNATLGKFASSIGMQLNAAEVQVPGGKLYTDGQTCEGKPGHVYVMTWSNPQEPASDGTLQNKKSTVSKSPNQDTCDPDCDSGVLLENDWLVTVAFLPAPAKGQTLSVLQPPQAVISRLATLQAETVTTTVPTTTPLLPTTTVAGATTTTLAGATTTTKATGATRTTAGATTTTKATSATTTTVPATTTTK
jgi:hypothetical protein